MNCTKELVLKLKTIKHALNNLEKVIISIEEQEWAEVCSAQNREKMYRVWRDALILRFKYCVDLFWKFLKIYLEDYELLLLGMVCPGGIAREAVKIELLSEDEGVQCMAMIVNRNKTSHIYHEEVAQDIAEQVPEFYELMSETIKRVQDRLAE